MNKTIILFVVTAALVSGLTWKTVQHNSGPGGRFGHYMVADANGDLFVFGGNEQGAFQNDVWKFQYPVWTMMSSNTNNETMPALAHGSTVLYNGEMWIFGGFINDYGARIADIYVYNLAGDYWRSVTVGTTQPTPRSGAVGGVYNDKWYLFGGELDGGVTAVDELWCFDFATSSWAMLTYTPAPEARSYASAAIDGTKMYVYGGQDVNGQYLKDLWVLDFTTNQWTAKSLTTPLTPRCQHIAVIYEGQMYVYGGIAYDGTNYYSLADTWNYTISANTWEAVTVTAKPPSRTATAGAFTAGPDGTTSFVIFGGATLETINYYSVQTYLSDVWVLSVSTNSAAAFAPISAMAIIALIATLLF